MGSTWTSITEGQTGQAVSDKLDAEFVAIWDEIEATGIADATPGTGTTHTFDYSQGDMQQITAPAGGTLTLAFSNFPANKVSGFICDIINGGNCTITHPTGMLFVEGTSPTYTVSGTDRVLVVSDKDGVLTMTVVGYDLRI